VIVNGPTSSQALVNVDSSPSNNNWAIGISIDNPPPFKLFPHSIQFGTSGLEGRVQNDSAVLVDGAGCTNNSQSCQQTQKLAFIGCEPIIGNVTFTYNVVCNDPSSSCVPPSDVVTVTSMLQTGSGCPIAHTIGFSVANLASFADSGLTQPQATFNDDQTAYFGADIQSTEAVITSFDVHSVCIQLLSGNISCVPVTVQTLPPVNGYNPVFSIDMSQTTLASRQSGQVFIIEATIDVQFEGEKRSIFSQPAGLRSSVQILKPQVISPATPAKKSSSSNTSTIYIAVIAALGGIVVVGIIVAVVVVLKKRGVTAAV